MDKEKYLDNNKYLTVKELPVSERPYEKFEKYGAASLSDAELLAVIIKTGYKNLRSVDLSYEILNFSKVHSGLIGLNYMTLLELMKIKGIGKVKAIQILSIAELTKRMAKAVGEEGLKLLAPNNVAEYYMQEMRHLTREQIRIVFIDSKSRVLGDMVMSLGTVNSSIAAPREIFLNALKFEAASIIMIHNHPSGDPSPSKEDLNTTKRIQEAGNLIGVKLMDHIIIGNNKYISLKREGIL